MLDARGLIIWIVPENACALSGTDYRLLILIIFQDLASGDVNHNFVGAAANALAANIAPESGNARFIGVTQPAHDLNGVINHFHCRAGAVQFCQRRAGPQRLF